MPYFIKSNSLISSYPKSCPFCSLREAITKFRQTFSKMRLSKIPGRALSETIKPFLPGCEECSKWFRNTRVLMFVFGFTALFGPIWVFFSVEMWGKSKLATYIWMATVIIWAALLLFRKWKGNSFKIVYFSENEVIYSGNEEKYMAN